MNAYLDGSVLIYMGGVEMGQGLFTKMIQIASRVLGLPVEHIHIKETNTDTSPNATPTGASFTSDIFGMAVKVCRSSLNVITILLLYLEKDGSISFAQVKILWQLHTSFSKKHLPSISASCDPKKGVFRSNFKKLVRLG